MRTGPLPWPQARSGGLHALPRRSALAFLLAVAGTAALPADAAAEVLVSNLGQVAFEEEEESSRISQRFDTGTNRHGYRLASVSIVSKDAEGDSFEAAVCTVTGDDQPTDDCTALTAPVSFAAGTLTFTAPPNHWLAKKKRYAVVLTPASGATVTYDTTRFDGQTGLPGWNIAGEFRVEGESGWEEAYLSRSLRMRLDGATSTTSPDIEPTGVPVISGTPLVGRELSAEGHLRHRAARLRRPPRHVDRARGRAPRAQELSRPPPRRPAAHPR